MERFNRPVVLFVALLALLSFASMAFADAPKPGDPKKQTTLGLYIDASEAAKWVNDKKAVIIDVRTPEELVFVGHTGVAQNIPFQFWKGELVQKDGKIKPKMIDSATFVTDVKKKFKPEDIIIVMCRSGHRSGAAVNALAKEGFKKAYTMVDGFEGDAAKEGPNKGKRTVNGWKNANIPWTYTLKEDLIWTPAK